jgi:cell division septation protein DedD
VDYKLLRPLSDVLPLLMCDPYGMLPSEIQQLNADWQPFITPVAALKCRPSIPNAPQPAKSEPDPDPEAEAEPKPKLQLVDATGSLSSGFWLVK